MRATHRGVTGGFFRLSGCDRVEVDSLLDHPKDAMSSAGETSGNTPIEAWATPEGSIDAFAPLREGAYADGLVTVSRDASLRSLFAVCVAGGRIEVRHRLGPADLDDGLADLLARELFATGLVAAGGGGAVVAGGEDVFQRIFTGIVRGCDPAPLTAWTTFYANTLARLERPDPGTPGHRGLAAYAPVYARAAGLVTGESALELGCCFGFLSLRLALQGLEVIASDLNPGTVRLLQAVAGRLGVGLTTVCADAAAVGLPDGCADTVLAIHLLEHLPPEHGVRVVAEAIRLARRRVVIGVPYESEPEAAYGHVRTFDHDELERLGQGTRVRFQVFDHHGGWLVLDPPGAG